MLAAAIEAQAQYLVTANLKDFPLHAWTDQSLMCVSPDKFLRDLLVSSPVGVRKAIARRISIRRNRESRTRDFLLLIARIVPEFANSLLVDEEDLDSLVRWFTLALKPISVEQAEETIRELVHEEATCLFGRDTSVFSRIHIHQQRLIGVCNADTTKYVAMCLLEGPLDNLADLLSIPLTLKNEVGCQLRQHVKSIQVIGSDFGCSEESMISAFAKGTGMPLTWLSSS